MRVLGIAARNVARQRRRAMLLGGAVALGAFVMLLVDSLTNGMAESLRSNVTAANAGEVYISGSSWQEDGTAAKRLGDDGPLRAAIADAAIRVVRTVRKTGAEGTLVFGSKSARLSIVGIPWSGSSSVLGKPPLGAGSLDGMRRGSGILIPKSVADRLGVGVGESVLVKAVTVTGQVNVLDFVVAAVLADSGSDLFSAGYARLERVNELVNLAPGESQQVNLYLEAGAGTEGVATALVAALRARGALVEDRASASRDPFSGRLPGGADPGAGKLPGMSLSLGIERLDPWVGTKYAIATLDDVASQYMTPVSSIKAIGIVVFAALLSMCMVGVVNTFRMVMIERTREIGTMRAMGASSREILRLFLAEAVMMTGGGSLAGILAGLAVMPVVSAFHGAKAGVFAMFMSEGHILFRPTLPGAMAIVILVVAAGSLAALSPARQAAALQPAAALRSVG